ncbi:MAG: cupredoxin domain-containing protein [Spongiibacteraceae bacterium]|nr:cupredoxin domain-containing protein [Spongiibacteraceae bacterium]
MCLLFKRIRTLLSFSAGLLFWILLAGPTFADDALLTKGESVFNTVAGLGCKGCHGEFAEGDLGVGPFIRGANEGMIRAAIDGIGAMVVVKASITDEEIAAVSAFVSSLGSAQTVRTMAKRGRFLPTDLSVYPGTAVQLIVQNASTKAHRFSSDNMGTPSLSVPARKAGSLTWRAPDEEGKYTLFCNDCKLKDQYFTINVSKSAKPFRAVQPTLVAK